MKCNLGDLTFYNNGFDFGDGSPPSSDSGVKISVIGSNNYLTYLSGPPIAFKDLKYSICSNKP
ncbi:hypothetical protein COV12_01075 [Candidatus Woesearchaeota archaeon CG10_big_fil_rev_8_21_14_0_10_32_24]|nr:MAG: hypothetical protein COV12_01075 [Candidatus Woesearchaeota archaeon CG10_big_fil_rev_8_21_14_0_10_32_24]